MTMYHMAMPPQFGGVHPPPMHSSIFPTSLMTSVNHSHAAHTYASQPSGGNTTETPTSVILHASPIVSQAPSSFYPSRQPSVYINPYMGSTHPQNLLHPSSILPHHGLHHDSHSHPQNVGYAMGNTSIPLLHQSHTTHTERQRLQDQVSMFANSRRQPLSVDEELLEEMNKLHLGYLETEDSPHKMEQREKLEDVIMEYLTITPHSHKFAFHQVLEVLENSILNKPDFSAHAAACAFDALAQYAANLISQPWRKEFREIKLHNGFWVHQVASQLIGAEYILELIGYICVAPKTPSSPPDSRRRNLPAYYVLQGVIDPDLIARLALDCMIAYCECQCLNKIKEGATEFGLPWGQILQFRQHYIGGVDMTVRHLLFTLRQCVSLPYQTQLSPDSNLATSPPPVPVRQSSSFAVSTAAPFLNASSKVVTGFQHSPLEARLEASASVDDSRTKLSLRHSPDNQKNNRSLSLTGTPATGGNGPGKINHLKYNSSDDSVDGAHSVSSESSKGLSSPKVPIAKLIDLESSNENITHRKSNQHLLPKVLPHKPSLKNSSHQSVSRFNFSSDHPECSPPVQPPPEAFQAGTFEEHLEATLNLVKNPNRSSGQASKNFDANSLETWDFVFRKLEKKGYNKDIGDRGDILHEIVRQKNCPTSNTVSGKNVNINLNNQRKDMPKNRTLTINQAMQQLNLKETKEKVDRPPSSKSSHTISHAYVHENHQRNSLYDNVSGAGFETANQDSDDSDDRHSSLLKKVNNASRQESSLRLDSCHKNCDSGSVSQKSGGLPSNRLTDHPPRSNKQRDCHESNISSGAKNWACITCTYENKCEVNVCEMCGKSKDPGPDSKPLEAGGKQCPLCTLINDKSVEVCSACGVDLIGSSTYI